VKRLFRNEGYMEDEDDIFRPQNDRIRKKVVQSLKSRPEVTVLVRNLIDNHLDSLYIDKLG
jgi:hypothetical protein